MEFGHSDEIWRDFPALVPGVLYCSGVTRDVSVGARTAKFLAIAKSRLAEMPEGEMPEIQAWRRAFARMGLKPTQYRCASESLLRRFRKEGTIPRLHPLVDLCNAVSLAFAVPVAVLDASAITGDLEVRYAAGDEDYVTFSGDAEHPAVGEVIFADAAGRAHARRWTNRQSGLSAVRDKTATTLIVAEALHDSASADITELTATIAAELTATWSADPAVAVLTRAAPRFTFGLLRPPIAAAPGVAAQAPPVLGPFSAAALTGTCELSLSDHQVDGPRAISELSCVLLLRPCGCPPLEAAASQVPQPRRCWPRRAR